MKVIKIIIGLILSFAIIKSCSDLGEEEPRSATIYVILSLVLLLIPSYLFYSSVKNNEKNGDHENSSIKLNKENELDKFNK